MNMVDILQRFVSECVVSRLPKWSFIALGTSGLVGVVLRGGCRVYIVMFLMVNRFAHMFYECCAKCP